MSRLSFRLPDLGEGTVSAEIVSWLVKPGDRVAEGQAIADMSTEKAMLELPSPVSGVIVSLGGAPGDTVAVGAELIVFDTDAQAPVQAAAPATAQSAAAVGAGSRAHDVATAIQGVVTAQTGVAAKTTDTEPPDVTAHAGADAIHVRTSPATRRRALEAGIDLAKVPGSGPLGRVLPSDLGLVLAARSETSEPASKAPPLGDSAAPSLGNSVVPPLVDSVAPPLADSVVPPLADSVVPPLGDSPAPPGADVARAPHVRSGTEEIKIIGVRRVIAQRMSAAKRTIPHFTYVEEVDVTELEALRQHLNAREKSDQPKLTLLPFIVAALGRVLERFPQCNARYDEARATLIRHRPIHVGIATQTIHGLKVPVVRHAESLSLSALAAEIRRVSEAARNNSARPEDLSGSTITVTSLGKLGGIASTPIINAPEVAIVGVNRMVERPVVYRGAITVREIMNLSASFDHRFVDGFDAAAMIQALKQCLEHPATMWLP
jgi:2-oxoisovalerate dehydrogenase E2 component (dihydrolipoyl transacylase)